MAQKRSPCTENCTDRAKNHAKKDIDNFTETTGEDGQKDGKKQAQERHNKWSEARGIRVDARSTDMSTYRRIPGIPRLYTVTTSSKERNSIPTERYGRNWWKIQRS